MKMQTTSILWRRLDVPGHDAARLAADGGEWWLSGAAVFAYEAGVCRLNYDVLCDVAWRTRWANVKGWVGNEAVDLLIEADDARRWRVNGKEVRTVEGCIDIDFNFSPATNLLPIRRLDLAVDHESEVSAAWVTFPHFSLEPLAQRFRRVDEATYRYDAAYGVFTADLRVNEAGFVTKYPGLWEAESIG